MLHQYFARSDDPCILFWESADVSPGLGHPPSEVAADLRRLKEAGLLEPAVGIVVGRPYGYGAAWHAELKTRILDVVGDTTKPILYNVDIGHTDPILTLPIGSRAILDSHTNRFGTLSPAVT
jgi:muramoyltetrapeptide carboxypeptidase LdcA involved in peptidoglycan recycling